ncbi:MAG: hypothetical protein D4R41_05420 [Sediminibacterium sp.]|nr:MAG: hypothetical protein D4R41_05420 [Sediminibacterium sp.]
MNTQREDGELKEDSKEANKKTKIFVDEVRKNLMVAFEHLRVMIDEEDILKKLFKKDLKQYHKECLKEDIDLDYNTVSARLNVARMIHDFENEKIKIPEKIEYTPLRTLTTAFYKHDNQRELQIRAWEVATQKNKVPDMKMLLTQLKR